MADTKLTGLTENTSVAAEDLLYSVDDPSSAQLSRKITVANLLKIINALTNNTTPATADELLLYDAGGSEAQKITLANLFTNIDSMVVDEGGTTTTPAANKVRLYAKADGLLYSKDDAGTETQVSGGGGGVGLNMLANGGMRIAQRGTSFISTTLVPNSDGEYTLDRWALLSDGNDIVDVTQEASVLPTGAENAIKLEVETANKQFGIVQILEAADAEKIIGGVASLSFQARMAAADDNTHSLKAVVLAWDGTKDEPTLDVVGTWAASITPATNWTAENTPSSLTLTTSWQEFTIENISIDTASAKNVAVFIYCDQTDGAIDDAVYITNVKLEEGAEATDYDESPVAIDFTRCARYCFVWGGNNADEAACSMWVLLNNNSRGPFTLPTKMRTIPSLTISNVTHFLLYNGANQSDPVTSLTIGKGSPIAPRLDAIDSGAGYTVGAGFLAANGTTDARMIFDAELGV